MIATETQDEYSFSFPGLFNNYKYIKEIGCGSTCSVVLVEDKATKEKYSAKIIPKEPMIQKKLLQQIKKEIEILKILDHPNIIKIHDSFEIQTEKGEELIIIITEYCENGTFIDFIINSRHQKDELIKKIFLNFLSSIKYLHNKGISHGDIKLENILLDSKLTPKLCDFGYCHTKIIEGDDSKKGTLYYAAPELFKFGKFNSLKTDIYAIGISLYASMEIEFPFKDGDQNSIIYQIVSGNLSIRKEIDEKLLNLIVKCTEINPNKRPTIEDIINDEYFTGKQCQKETKHQNINEKVDMNQFDYFEDDYEFENEFEINGEADFYMIDKQESNVLNKLWKQKYSKKKVNKKIKKSRKSKQGKNKYKVEVRLNIKERYV